MFRLLIHVSLSCRLMHWFDDSSSWDMLVVWLPKITQNWQAVTDQIWGKSGQANMVTIEQMMKVTVSIIRSCCMLLRIGMWLLLWASPHRYKIIMVDKHIIYIYTVYSASVETSWKGGVFLSLYWTVWSRYILVILINWLSRSSPKWPHQDVIGLNPRWVLTCRWPYRQN